MTVTSWTPTVSFDTPGDLSVNYAVQLGDYFPAAAPGDPIVLRSNLTFTPTYTTAAGRLVITGHGLLPTAGPVGIFNGTVLPSANVAQARASQMKPGGNIRISAVPGANLDTTDFVSGQTYSLIAEIVFV